MIKNDIDSIMWIKLEKSFFNITNDRYIIATYIPPENSPVYNIVNIDLFRKIDFFLV